MPGPYAHITLLKELIRSGALASCFSLSSGFDAVLVEHFPYCVLGSVSPDYPNLAKAIECDSQWADAMHCTRACEMIASGIRRVRSSKGYSRDKQLAWLLGYCSHVAADVTIHPVVQAKVGVYAENQLQHRICEMNQDSYIFRRMNLGEIGESDCYALTVVQCSNSDDRTQLDRDIVTLWQGMLEDVYPERSFENPPNIACWHREFVSMVSECSADAVRLFPLAGVIASKTGLAYPEYVTVDRQFIDEQVVPSKKSRYLHYDDIFFHAACNVIAVWKQVELAICAIESTTPSPFGTWNLDTGRDENGRLIFWD
jgi:hypothetical protein